ncbi:response regulator [Paenibacillus thalictri]|uniref:Response regulator n=1 Tax=Paenibacillus thalictri TaxID=2527873 RepID=A0A4Q9DUH8_9BACL|nr:response regulator [Paenibacillus thalictri]TBL79068.1 response regulator [Paenibacillus thalictri]
MFKVVIVDDEPLVLRGLAERFPWKDWGCVVCGTALNGLEGKELIDREQPDIVLTDVKMPGLSGLELAEHVKRNHPDALTIVLSGFNEFDYARQALRQQVFDYLLKPVDKEELKKTLRKGFQHLNRRRETSRNTEEMEKKLSQVNPLAEAGILMDLMLNNKHEADSLHNRLKEFGISFQKGQVVVFEMLAVWEQHQNYKTLHQFALSNILYEIYEKYRCRAVIQWIAGKCTAAILFDSSIPSVIAQKRVIEATGEGIAQATSFFKQRVFAGMGHFVNRLDELNTSYLTALSSLEHHLFWSLEFAETGLASTERVVVRVDERMYDAVNEGYEDRALQEFDAVCAQLRINRDVDHVYSICLEIVMNLSSIAKFWELDLAIPNLSELKQHAFFDNLALGLRELILNLCLTIANKRQFITLPLMDKILAYIQDHYANPDLSLQDVANEFHLSVSHLSRMFKKEAGTNFNDYRSMVRIEQAKELLCKKYWLTSQETAYLVGFTDGKYFSQVFKKYCGMTPSEYKESQYTYE